jgi:hypothetical protein
MLTILSRFRDMPKIWIRITDKHGTPLPGVNVQFTSETCSKKLTSDWSTTDSKGWTKAAYYSHVRDFDGHTFYVSVGGRRIGHFVFRDGLEATFRCP